MPESPLNPAQIQKLEALLRGGFRFLTLERYERYLAVEKDNFVALLDPANGGLAIFSQAGYLMGGGIGMLVEGAASKEFVYHGQKVTATLELLDQYEAFKRSLNSVLNSV